MKNHQTASEKYKELRRKAEEKLERTFNNIGESPNEQDIYSIKHLMHELQVYQTELEMQNDELQQAQTALKDSQKELADLYHSAPISYLTLDKTGVILDVNQTAAEKFSTEGEFLVNKKFYDFIREEERDYLYLHLVDVLKSDQLQRCELKVHPRTHKANSANDEESTTFWALLESKAFQQTDGTLLCRTVLSDITDRKQMEKELEKAKEKAEENDYLKSAFLANMSHEIRTPMNGILGFTDLLAQSKITLEEKSQYLDIINKSGHRLMNTVNDIIEISKIEAGIASLESNEIDTNQKIDDLYQFFLPEANNKGLQLTIAEKLPNNSTLILTDESKLESIFTNLIKNALKYTNVGSIQIGCRLSQNCLHYYVSDTGIGVPANRQDAIFNRFEQADIGDKRAFEGSGLGLALTKSYVEMMGGTIGVNSIEGKGATFYVDLPFRQSHAQQTKRPSDLATAPTDKEFVEQEYLKDKNLKVLVAEDDKASYLVLSLLLKKINCEILHAKTGKEAIDMVRQHSDIDIILMDIKMPEMDGREAARQIRTFSDTIYLIAQTSYALKGDQEKSLEAGFNDHITKPVQENALMTAIYRSIEK